MANCASFQNLTIVEKYEFIGKLIHAVQNDEQCFHQAAQTLNYGEREGIFENIIINPPLDGDLDTEEHLN